VQWQPLLDNQVGLVDAYACIAQTVNLDCDHGLAGFNFAEFAFEAFQRAADNTDMIACPEDSVFYLDLRIGLSQHELQVLYL
jgi:hypothetical protein